MTNAARALGVIAILFVAYALIVPVRDEPARTAVDYDRSDKIDMLVCDVGFLEGALHGTPEWTDSLANAADVVQRLAHPGQSTSVGAHRNVSNFNRCRDQARKEAFNMDEVSRRATRINSLMEVLKNGAPNEPPSVASSVD